MTLYGKSGMTYTLPSAPIAQGGEGEIYALYQPAGTVAKIYKEHIDLGDREAKLISMVENPPDAEQLKQIAWPLDVLYNSARQFVGFTMPKLDVSEDLNVLYEYGPTSKYPDLKWSSKIVIAKNLCAVVDSIHCAKHVIGDFNPKNISVNPKTGRITMLDTDSYHIEEGKYRCVVGMPDYLPAEIQKKMKGGGLATANLPTFTEKTDDFALAVHIFQLLMNGAHPFSAAIAPGFEHLDVSVPADNIVKNRTPFFRQLRGRIPPKFAPSVKILPKSIRKMFFRAFVKGHFKPAARPSATQWHAELCKLEGALKTCTRFSWHEYPKAFKRCPLCAADVQFKKTRQQHQKQVKTDERKKREKKEKEEKVKVIKAHNGGHRLSKETREALLYLIGAGVVVAILFVILWLRGTFD